MRDTPESIVALGHGALVGHERSFRRVRTRAFDGPMCLKQRTSTSFSTSLYAFTFCIRITVQQQPTKYADLESRIDLM